MLEPWASEYYIVLVKIRIVDTEARLTSWGGYYYCIVIKIQVYDSLDRMYITLKHNLELVYYLFTQLQVKGFQ